MVFCGLVRYGAVPVCQAMGVDAQAVLGIAFSMGIPMAFVAQSDGVGVWQQATQLPALVWVLLCANLLWVLAYDTVYAMVDRNDDIRLGIKTSALTLGRFDLLAVALFTPVIWGCSGRFWTWHITPRVSWP